MNLHFDRRYLLQFGAVVPASLLLPARASADDLLELLGLRAKRAPDPPADPKKPLDPVLVLTSILALEGEANRRQLPSSTLAMHATSAINTPSSDTSSVYQLAVPRLVTLIDRSAFADPALAEQAGALLAQVNASEHQVPEALATPDLPLSPAHSFSALKDEYARLFTSAQVRDEHTEKLQWYVGMIRQSKARYEGLSKTTGVPWYFIGAIHGMESSFNFRAHFHNGDFPLSARTRQVPSGHPKLWLPPSDWESSARDALKLLGFTGQSDWGLERTLYRLEAYNGFGYRKHGVPTPYLWCFSNHYESGKFVADGQWSPSAQSHQCGAAVVLKALSNAGESIAA
jgi:lysozyme family protein